MPLLWGSFFDIFERKLERQAERSISYGPAILRGFRPGPGKKGNAAQPETTCNH